MERIVKKLINNKETISTMESCTGGYLASCITNVASSSEVLKFSAVTYSNEFKIKMGVNENIINKYTVYSIEVAKEMAYNISKYANSTYGIGITGKINRPDKNNPSPNDFIVYIAIYNKKNNKYYEYEIKVLKNISRKDNKDYLVKNIINKLLDIIK